VVSPGKYARAGAGLALLLVLMTSSPAVAEETSCEPHQLQPADLKQRLRRWRGLAAFNRWRLTEVQPAACLVDGEVATTLQLVPPAAWSHHRVPYQVQIRVRVNGETGVPLAVQENNYKRLASGVRRLVLRAEAHDTVRRFIERFNPAQAWIVSTNGPEKLKVVYRSATCPGCPADKHPELVFSEAAKAGVVAYQLPRMDSLPVRRELLRFVEALSKEHTHCIPAWIAARWRALPPTEEEEQVGQWEIEALVTGRGCPASFARVVNEDLTVENRVTTSASPSSSGS
jgi:hypothetical protein